jgi:hypothetical protein
MNYSLTIFTSIFDNKTHRKMEFKSWSGFEDLLYSLSEQPGYKPKKHERKDGSPLITPASFTQNTTRKNDNVLSWGGWVAMDIDSYEGSFENAASIFAPYTHVCYSSASSTTEAIKFRVILPMTRHVEAAKIRHLWYACNKQFNSLGDPQTKDLSRMYYVPAQYPNSNNFIYSGPSKTFLDPDALMSQYPYIDNIKASSFADKLPDEIREKIRKYKREGLSNTNFKWNSYADCPFVNKNMINEYRTIHSGGWYAKMYQIMLNIASNAMRKGYPITSNEVASLCKQIDLDTGGWYKNRPMEVESARAIERVAKSL